MRLFLTIAMVFTLGAKLAMAGSPIDLLRGEAPVLFVQGERDGQILRDGVTMAGTDDIILWLPTLDGEGMVDLTQTGQFFRIWDSGPVAGPNGNDDNRNELRGLHFEIGTGTFLLTYDDSTTTGFDFGPFPDGDLMRMAHTAVTDGFITNMTLERVFNEGAPGTGTLADPVLTSADLWGVAVLADDTLVWSSGSGNFLAEDGVSSASKGVLDLAHTEGFDPPVANAKQIGADLFFVGLFSGDDIPSFNAGQMRGVDELVTEELLISASEGTEYWLDQLDDPAPTHIANGQIFSLDPVTKLVEIVYDGDVFFSDAALKASEGEIMGFDVLDSHAAIEALIDVVGAKSAAGTALAAHLPSGGLLGDLNCDGVVSVGDINPFVLALTDPAAYAAQFPDCDILNGDCSDDEQVSVGDINCFVALVTGG